MSARIDHILRHVAVTPLAILPEKLAEIEAVLTLRAHGESVSEEQIAAVVAASESRNAKRVQGSGSVAVIPVMGTIGRRIGGMAKGSGGFDLEDFNAAFQAAVNDPKISTIVLHVDSPGGAVPGVDEAARKVYEARGQKRIIAVADGLMASAAYYIGSAAHELVATQDARVGSIGVYLLHIEVSRALDREGVTATLFKAGKHKAEGNPYTPLTAEARANIQEEIEGYYTLFVDAVARHRGVSPAAVRNGYGEARALLAESAKAEGLIDRIATLEEVLAELGVGPGAQARVRADEAGNRTRACTECDGGTMDWVDAADDSCWECRECGALVINAEANASDPWAAAEQHSEWIAARFAAANAANETIEVHATFGDVVPQGAVANMIAEVVEEARERFRALAAAASEATAGAAGDAPTADIAAPAADTAPLGQSEDTMAGTNATAAPANGATPQVTVGADALASERQRAADITALCATHGMAERASEWIAQGISADAAGRRILQMRGEPEPVTPRAVVDMTEREQRQYSVVRAINAAATGDWRGAEFEAEVNAEIERKLNRSAKGVFVPTALGPLGPQGPQAALTSGGATAGRTLVFTEPGSFIDMLRTRMVVAQLGATFLPGLQGNVSFPKQTGAGTLSWRAENPGADVTDSDLALDQVTLSPKSASSTTAFSRQLLAQSNINVEQLVRQDLAAITARGLDKAALHGTGTTNQPTGIYAASGVNAVAFGGSVTYPKVVAMETAIVAENADIGSMGYVTTPGVRGAAKTTQIFSSTNGAPLWTGGVEDGEMNGHRALASNQVSAALGVGTDEHGIIFGVWDQLLIGEWGAMEIIVDPYRLKKQALIEVTCFIMADVALRHAQAFAKGTGLKPA